MVSCLSCQGLLYDWWPSHVPTVSKQPIFFSKFVHSAVLDSNADKSNTSTDIYRLCTIFTIHPTYENQRKTDFEENKKCTLHSLTGLPLCFASEKPLLKRIRYQRRSASHTIKSRVSRHHQGTGSKHLGCLRTCLVYRGKRIPASAEYAEEKHKIIKSTLFELFGEEASDIPVLYGGSVNPQNANQLIVQPSIDGLFTGRSAWQADNFNSLIRDAKELTTINNHIKRAEILIKSLPKLF